MNEEMINEILELEVVLKEFLEQQENFYTIIKSLSIENYITTADACFISEINTNLNIKHMQNMVLKFNDCFEDMKENYSIILNTCIKIYYNKEHL